MGLYTEGHEEYYNSKGIEVPSVTTILKLLNKPAIPRWANSLGFKHLSYDKTLEESAHYGTNVHNALDAYFKNVKYIPELKYSDEELKIRTSLYHFFSWKNKHELNTILNEKKLVGEEYGGTLDWYGEIDGKLTILDFKTSKDFNASMFLQLSAYTHLIEEYSSYKVEQVAILILNYKNPKFKFKILSKEEIEPYFGVFNDLQKLFGKVYSLDKINKEKKINTIL